MALKTIVSCGCSFMTSSYWLYHAIKGEDWPESFPYTDEEFQQLSQLCLKEMKQFKYVHSPGFIDYYAKEKHLQHINLANCGSSNFQIRLQVEQAIKFNPDYVIVSATAFGRGDFPSRDFDYEKLIRNFDNRSANIFGDFSNILTDVDSTFAYDKKAEQEYFKNYLIYADPKIQEIKEYYIIQSGLALLEHKKIPFVFLPGPMTHLDWLGYEIVWPSDRSQPWDYPAVRKGISSTNHCTVNEHQDFLNTLKDITITWN